MTSEQTANAPSLPFPLQAGEEVIQLCRRHWWFLWPRTLLWFLFAVVPVIALVWVLSAIDVMDDLGVFVWLPIGLWLAYWAVRLLLNWYQYHHDIWVITNQRIIDSLKPTPFRLRIATADLVNVQDMSVVKSGIFPSLLNFGDVVCQTAATGQQFCIAGVPNPAGVQFLVDKERDRERGRYS